MSFVSNKQYCVCLGVLSLFLVGPLGIGQTSTTHGKTMKVPAPKNQGALFDADLQARSDVPQVVPTEGHEGTLVGSGDGTVRGSRIRGKLRWSNFEKVGPRLCEMNLAGIIETEDGAHIHFESKGFAHLTNPPTWNTAGTMRFTTEDKRYAWLNELFANWQGNYDASKEHGALHAFSASVGNMGSSPGKRPTTRH
jgi:hypothetical protein